MKFVWRIHYPRPQVVSRGPEGEHIEEVRRTQRDRPCSRHVWIPSLPVILALARALRVDEKHLLKIALTEKVPEVAERFFVEEAKVKRAREGLKGPEEEMFEMVSSDEEVRLEMRKYFEFLKRRLSGRGKAGIYPSKALREFMEDPRMPKPTDEELRLLMSVNLEYKEPNKWFYKSLLDSYRNNALFARVRRAKVPAKP